MRFNSKTRIMRYFKYLIVTVIISIVVQYLLYPYPWNRQQKIAVIGAGLAGLSAAITAANEGNSKVYLYEKTGQFGGNSAKATSGINGVYSSAQMEQNVEDSYDLFHDDTMKSGKGSCSDRLVRTLVEDSTAAIAFLKSYGADLETLSQCGGHSAKRTHRCDPNKIKFNVGGHIMQKLSDAAASIRNIRGLLGNEVKEIRSRGTKFEVLSEYEGVVESRIVDKVILTTGGFAADTKGLITQYRPEYTNFPTTNGPGSTGDGIKLGKSLGGNTIHLTYVQVHPTGFISRKTSGDGKVFLAPEALRGSGGLLMKSPGVRFVNELGTRDDVTAKILEEGEDAFGSGRIVASLFLNQKAAELFGISKLVGFYGKKGLVKEYDNFEAFCNSKEGKDYDYGRVKDTLEKYNSEMKTKGIDSFGKKFYPVAFHLEDKIYRMFVTPSIHYTMGGLQINEFSQVLDSNGKSIMNLFAAGEVTGGVHGKNRLGGNSLLECVVFGRIAGRTAAN